MVKYLDKVEILRNCLVDKRWKGYIGIESGSTLLWSIKNQFVRKWWWLLEINDSLFLILSKFIDLNSLSKFCCEFISRRNWGQIQGRATGHKRRQERRGREHICSYQMCRRHIVVDCAKHQMLGPAVFSTCKKSWIQSFLFGHLIDDD